MGNSPSISRFLVVREKVEIIAASVGINEWLDYRLACSHMVRNGSLK